MPAEYELRFLVALVLTLLIEVPLLLVLVSRFSARRQSTGFVVFVGMSASLLTLPYLWFLLPAFVPLVLLVPIAEAVAVLVETGVYAVLLSLPPSRAFVLSLICNAASFVLGGFLLARF